MNLWKKRPLRLYSLIKMPDMDSIEALKKIKETCYTEKPFTPEELLTAVREVFERNEKI